MSYSTFKKIFFCCVMFSSSTYPMEDVQDFKSDNFMKNVLVGGAAGTAEVLVNQPTVFFKNALQQQKNVVKLVSESPALLYKGLGVNAVCMVPTTAAQISVNNALKDFMPNDDTQTALVRNALAGGCSALVCNPSELVIVNQQNWNTNALATACRLYEQEGVGVSLRGYAAKAVRDSAFCAGFLTVYPLVKNKLEKEQGFHGMGGTIIATGLVGPVTAVASHPFDTISTKMQADSSKNHFKGFFDTAKKVYRQGGKKAFLAGLAPRTARIMIAIPLMDEVSRKVRFTLP